MLIIQLISENEQIFHNIIIWSTLNEGKTQIQAKSQCDKQVGKTMKELTRLF